MIDNDGSKCSVSENTILSAIKDVFVIMSSNILTLDLESSGYKSVMWSNFVVSMYNDGSMEYMRICSDSGTAEDPVCVCESEIPMSLENDKSWYTSSKPWDCDFYLSQRAFPET